MVAHVCFGLFFSALQQGAPVSAGGKTRKLDLQQAKTGESEGIFVLKKSFCSVSLTSLHAVLLFYFLLL